MNFSIVIPVYNGEKYIYEALKCAYFQERSADEIIVYDDGSTDKTWEICNRDEFRGQLHLYKNPEGPSGFVNAWNKAISKANGDYITLLHHDDLLDLRYLKIIEKVLEDYPDVKHIYSACNYIDERGNITGLAAEGLSSKPQLYSGKEYRKKYLRGSAIDRHIHRCPGVTTYKKIFENCTYREEAGLIADDDFFYRVGKYTDVIGISIPLASYRHHGNSETGHLEKIQLNDRLAKDHLFQSQFHASYEYFDREDVMLFNKLAVDNINSLMRYGLLFRDKYYAIKAEKYRNELKLVHPNTFYDYMPFRHRLMWILRKYCQSIGLGTFYVALLDYARQKRDKYKLLIKR
jgi:glycosyltransferase involved in cell wall biosynthesis